MRRIVTLYSLAAAIASAQSIPVKVPAGMTTTIAKHIPASTRERFAMEATSGQTLLVDLDDSKGAVEIFGPAAAGTKPLPSIDLGGSNDWMNVLSKTGTYEIAVRPSSKKPYDLSITLMDPHDPRLDPGLTADKVSLDLGVLGGKPKLSFEPFHPALGGEIDDPWPANLFVQQEHVEFRIMSLEGLKKRMARDKEWMAQLGRLEAALKPGGKLVTPELLPPGSSDAAMMFGSRMEYVEGPSVRALRYIGQFAQEDLPPTDSLTYVLYGISRDGKYFVAIRSEVSFPPLPKSVGVVPVGPKLKALQADASRRLNAAKPEVFKPPLGQLDAIARTLRLP